MPVVLGFDTDEVETPALRKEDSEAHSRTLAISAYGEDVRLPGDQARERFASARVARLASVSADGNPHAVPIVFAVAGDVLYTAVDAKPKTTAALRRLANIAANPRVSVLADHYADDWTQLWWVRVDGAARIAEGDEAQVAIRLLRERYPQYVEQPPPGPVLAIDVERWSGWAATEGEPT
jgi:PPOX class probable F420-dependent enzyme